MKTPSGLPAYIYRNGTGDFSSGGISSKTNEVTVVDPKIDEIFEATEDRPAVKLVQRTICGDTYVHAELLTAPADADKYSLMFGGTYIESSDSRFSRAVRSLGWKGPVPLHDRYESFR